MSALLRPPEPLLRPAAAPTEPDEFTSAFEHAAIGMSVVSPDNRRLRVNRAFCAMLGYTRDELLARTVHDITHPADVAQDVWLRTLLIAGQQDSYHREKRYLRKDGALVWGYMSCTLVRDAQGAPRHYIVQVQDITERKLAQQRLAEAEGLLSMAAAVGKLGAWAFDAVRRELVWSDELRRIHEVGPGFQLTLQRAMAFILPEYRVALSAACEACLRDGTPVDMELALRTARGKRLWARLSGEPVRDAHGRVRRIQGAFQDISEIKRAHEQARRMGEQLTNTLESLTDAFFTLDRQWRFTYLNAEAERMLRRTREELLGRVAWEEFADVAGTRYQRHLERAMAENVTVQFDSFYPNFGIWVSTKAYPSEQGLAIYVKDVTERVTSQREVLRLNAELEERVRQRTAELEAANRELQAFSYSIAHDLRSPLSSIDGFSQVLEKAAEERLDERCRHYLRRIRTAVRGMSELTEGMLSLASLSRVAMRSEPVDLAAMARTVLAECRERDAAREVAIAVPDALPATGDARLLLQVMANLLGNAWKFTARTPGARIEVGVERSHGREVFFVRDNGAGFDMQQAARMFEAFQRLHTATEFEGTGIGLAIVQRIVARHGGRVWAQAAPGSGATFFFTLADTAN